LKAYLLILVLASISGGCFAVDGFIYSVSGTVVSQYGPHLDGGRGASTSDFSVSVDGGSWIVRVVPKLVPNLGPALSSIGNREAKPDYMEASSDGTNVYFVISTESTKRADTKVINAGEATRIPGTVPYAIPDELICLWYLYASHSYFSALHESRIYPLNGLPPEAYMKQDFKVPAEWVLSQGPPRLPVSILVKGSGQWREATNTASSLSYTATNAILQVPRITNVFGLQLPVDGEIRSFFYFQPQQPTLRKTIVVTAETFSNRSMAEGRMPALPTPSIVMDASFWTNEQPATVSMLTNKWPDEVALLALYKAKIRTEALHKSAAASRQSKVRWFLAIAMVMPIVFGALWFFNRKRKKCEL
jgi:hypothetical protein